jgi:LysM repeat protein
VVQPGDNLSTIADLYRVPLPALLMWNDLNPHKHIHPGDQLIIYAPARPENEPETQ